MTGQEMHAIRLELRWSRGRLARYLGYSYNYLAQLERGRRPINEKTARAMTVLQLAYRLCGAVGLIEIPSSSL
jgi:transcriptional regulator with XRE-family HTH domain